MPTEDIHNLHRRLDRIETLIVERINVIDREVSAHKTRLEGTPESAGLITAVDRLQQAEANRRWQFRAIWSTIATAVTGAIFALFGRD